MLPACPGGSPPRSRPSHPRRGSSRSRPSYGAEDSALRFSGVGDVRFGASPLLRAALSARQLDADRFVAKGNSGAEPLRLLPGLRALMAAVPQTAPIPAQIEFTSDQIMLGGRPLQNLTAALQADAKSWAIDRLEFRAPGATRVSLGGSNAQAGSFTGALSVDSADPDTLVTWLQGRSEVTYRSQKPLRLRGDVTVAPDRVSIEAMKAEIDGGAVEGRAAVSTAGGSSRIDAELKAERLDLDAATALARSLAGPQAEWPDEARLVARYRPRHVGRSGIAPVPGEGSATAPDRSRWTS